jgi:hypothetical protein
MWGQPGPAVRKMLCAWVVGRYEAENLASDAPRPVALLYTRNLVMTKSRCAWLSSARRDYSPEDKWGGPVSADSSGA